MNRAALVIVIALGAGPGLGTASAQAVNDNSLCSTICNSSARRGFSSIGAPIAMLARPISGSRRADTTMAGTSIPAALRKAAMA